MNLTTASNYKRMGKKVSITVKIELEKSEIDRYNESYNEAYMFVWYIYNDSEWIVETKIEHDIYKMSESSKSITNNQLVECLLNSEVYPRIKKAMKIK